MSEENNNVVRAVCVSRDALILLANDLNRRYGIRIEWSNSPTTATNDGKVITLPLLPSYKKEEIARLRAHVLHETAHSMHPESFSLLGRLERLARKTPPTKLWRAYMLRDCLNAVVDVAHELYMANIYPGVKRARQEDPTIPELLRVLKNAPPEIYVPSATVLYGLGFPITVPAEIERVVKSIVPAPDRVVVDKEALWRAGKRLAKYAIGLVSGAKSCPTTTSASQGIAAQDGDSGASKDGANPDQDAARKAGHSPRDGRAGARQTQAADGQDQDQDGNANGKDGQATQAARWKKSVGRGNKALPPGDEDIPIEDLMQPDAVEPPHRHVKTLGEQAVEKVSQADEVAQRRMGGRRRPAGAFDPDLDARANLADLWEMAVHSADSAALLSPEAASQKGSAIQAQSNWAERIDAIREYLISLNDNKKKGGSQ